MIHDAICISLIFVAVSIALPDILKPYSYIGCNDCRRKIHTIAIYISCCYMYLTVCVATSIALPKISKPYRYNFGFNYGK
jgi:hypothetical protein